MIVSWKWLADYIPLQLTPEEAAERWMMSGLNHEETKQVGDDLAIDLEVTSNRPDCLGHIGVARELGVLLEQAICLPEPHPPVSGPPAAQAVQVAVACPDLCPHYTARVLRGVRVAPSPDWLIQRLATIGVKPVNNIVDITNYVLFECGQPLHAFDLVKLAGSQIRVRRGEVGETIEAIDHKSYELTSDDCVIADAERAVAIGGVMGGAATEVGAETTDLLIEAARFNPLAIRNTARRLRLSSPSSYRFERGVDPERVGWASLRCCQLILEIAGGTLSEGLVEAAEPAPTRPPVRLRFAQLERLLGIQIPPAAAVGILQRLGLRLLREDAAETEWVAPSFRPDLTREADLIEEVARVHGYDKIPDAPRVTVAASRKRVEDRVLERLRHALTAAGCDEAMTISFVREEASAAFSPWSAAEPIRCEEPLLKGADCLRRSLIPSLLESRRENEAVANERINLFETARVYLPRPRGLPEEKRMLGIAADLGFLELKGLIETLLSELHSGHELRVEPVSLELFEPERAVRLRLDGACLGYLGVLAPSGLKRFKLRRPASVAELDLAVLEKASVLIPQAGEISEFPAITEDLNLIVAEDTTWADLEAAVASAEAEIVERLSFKEIFRDAERDGPAKKRVLFSLTLRDAARTLTAEDAAEARERILSACRERLGAALVS